MADRSPLTAAQAFRFCMENMTVAELLVLADKIVHVADLLRSEEPGTHVLERGRPPSEFKANAGSRRGLTEKVRAAIADYLGCPFTARSIADDVGERGTSRVTSTLGCMARRGEIKKCDVQPEAGVPGGYTHFEALPRKQ